VLAVCAGQESAYGQIVSPTIRIRAELDPAIRGYLRRDELPQSLNDELSEALAASIDSGGRWTQFCWNVAADDATTDMELKVLVKKDPAANWEYSVTFSGKIEGVKFVEPLQSTIVRSSLENTAHGPPSRAQLSQLMAEWFASHYLTPPMRENLHRHLCVNVPVGRGEIRAFQGGNEAVIYLPARFSYFRYSTFNLVCHKADGSIAFQATGTGKSEPQAGATAPLVALGVKPKGAPPVLNVGDKTSAYLVKYLRESELGELGDLPVF
jgi:hypothetical protein